MSDLNPAPVADPKPQGGDGGTDPTTDLDTGLIEREKAYLFPSEEGVPDEVLQIAALAELLRAAALADTRKEAADYRRKLRDLEGKVSASEKAKADEAEKQKAEQGKFQELYEAEKAKAAEAADKLARMEFDQQRRDVAQEAGIPQLWQRLQGSTPEELAEDAKGLAEMMKPAGGQPARTGTPPTPAPQGANGLTPDERRKQAARTF